MSYGNASDSVSATGVWVTINNPATDTEFGPTEWNPTLSNSAIWGGEMDPNVKSRVQFNGGTGVRAPIRVRDPESGQTGDKAVNVMAMRFSVVPSNVESLLPRVRFDISRLLEVRAWHTTVNNATPVKEVGVNDVGFPREWEVPNDDAHNRDESPKVNANGHMFVMDDPGPIGPIPNPLQKAKIWAKFNFIEYARVAFEGGRPDLNQNRRGNVNGKIKGSVASPDYIWTSESTIILTGPAWVRNNQGGNNRIVYDDWTFIGNTP
jgi:hypothetical protein